MITTWSVILGTWVANKENLWKIFFGVHSQCRSRTFLSGTKWVNMVVRTSRVEVAGVQIVSVIFLILGA
jgi:hypothetical protein